MWKCDCVTIKYNTSLQAWSTVSLRLPSFTHTHVWLALSKVKSHLQLRPKLFVPRNSWTFSQYWGSASHRPGLCRILYKRKRKQELKRHVVILLNGDIKTSVFTRAANDVGLNCVYSAISLYDHFGGKKKKRKTFLYSFTELYFGAWAQKHKVEFVNPFF